MPYCTSCGQTIPDGQGSSCSMCYGDPYHGSDGYYLKYLQQDAEAHAAQQAAEEQQPREDENQDM